jgi:phage terminase large subunit-like protein
MTSTRRLISLIASGAAAISAVILFMIAPLVLYRLATGGSLNHEGADWEIWLLVGGGGVGAGVAFWIHHNLLTRVFGFSPREADRAWRRT